MSSYDEKEFDERLRRVMRKQTDTLVFTQEMQERVMQNVLQKTQSTNPAQSKKRLPKISKSWLSAGMSGLIACLLVVVVFLQIGTHPAPKVAATSNKMSLFMAAQAPAPAMNTLSSARTLQASLAPVQTSSIQLVTKNQFSLSDRSFRTMTPFTVLMHLRNNTNHPIAGTSLQGMLFILTKMSNLSPQAPSDWEYFINGPTEMIAPHATVSWTFTPNPVPPFHSLQNRFAHVIWMYRTLQPGYPQIQFGTLPIAVTATHINVIKTLPNGMQYLSIKATLNNHSQQPWSMRSALAMIFFKKSTTSSTFATSTYKYFDDVTPVAGQSSIVMPGQSQQVDFLIGGIPGVDLTHQVMSIYLMDRHQLGA